MSASTKEFKNLVKKHIMKTYGVSEFDAQIMIRNSYLPTALQRQPQITMHDSIESWAEDIYEYKDSAEDLKQM